ncbi:uncharacterized protein DEA37_0002110, partial [Paragonimus westermani]
KAARQLSAPSTSKFCFHVEGFARPKDERVQDEFSDVISSPDEWEADSPVDSWEPPEHPIRAGVDHWKDVFRTRWKSKVSVTEEDKEAASDSFYTMNQLHYLHLLNDSTTLCNDGTPAGYYYRRSKRGMSRNWLIFLEAPVYIVQSLFDEAQMQMSKVPLLSGGTYEKWTYIQKLGKEVAQSLQRINNWVHKAIGTTGLVDALLAWDNHLVRVTFFVNAAKRTNSTDLLHAELKRFGAFDRN